MQSAEEQESVAVTEPEIFTDSQGIRRVRNQELVLKVAVGTVAFWLGKKASEYHSHKWTVFVRGEGMQDISRYISKVTFQLHASFPNPIRVVDSPPFELTETGWGEFEIGVKLHLNPEAREKDVELFHALRLYSETDGMQNQVSKRPVVSEEIEEIVFSEPPKAFYLACKTAGSFTSPASSVAQFSTNLNADEELARIQAARHKAAQFKAAILKQLQSNGE